MPGQMLFHHVGSKVFPAGIASVPAGMVALPMGMASIPTGIASLPMGMAKIPTGSASIPTGSDPVPEGIIVLPAGKGTIPAGKIAIPMGKFRNQFEINDLTHFRVVLQTTRADSPRFLRDRGLRRHVAALKARTCPRTPKCKLAHWMGAGESRKAGRCD